ncbi:MAG: hypothetical protein Q7T34_02505, partial [Candidatus Parcubacteria bacterium]|nr:hypothetical protein [Candidatus Parcubacteria bacterium]
TAIYFLFKRKNRKSDYLIQNSISKFSDPIVSFAVSEFNRNKRIYLAGVKATKLLIGKYAYFSLIIIVIMLFSFFYSLNPTISQAKSIGMIRQRTSNINHHIKESGLELRNTFLNSNKVIFLINKIL